MCFPICWNRNHRESSAKYFAKLLNVNTVNILELTFSLQKPLSIWVRYGADDPLWACGREENKLDFDKIHWDSGVVPHSITQPRVTNTLLSL